MTNTAALLAPVVSAASVIVWVAAAVLARAAQTDHPSGPAPLADQRAARRALGVCAVGLGVAVAQVLALMAGVASGIDGVAPAAWTALAAAVTGALLAARRALGPLRRMANGHAITDVTAYRAMHAALGAAAVSGVVAALVAVAGAGLVAGGAGGGPYLAPVLAVTLVVLGSHALLGRGAQLVPA